MKELSDRRTKVANELDAVRIKNKNIEVMLRDTHGKGERNYEEILKLYDQEMTDK